MIEIQQDSDLPESQRLLGPIFLSNIPDDEMNVFFIFCKSLNTLSFNIEFLSTEEVSEEGIPLLSARVSNEEDKMYMEYIMRRFMASPAGRILKDVSDGNYAPFMPEERYNGQDSDIVRRYKELDPRLERILFLTAYNRHLELRTMRAEEQTLHELMAGMSSYAFDKGAQGYARDLTTIGVEPMSFEDSCFIAANQLWVMELRDEEARRKNFV